MKRFIFLKFIPVVVIVFGIATYGLYLTTGQSPWSVIGRWQGIESNLKSAANSRTATDAARSVEKAAQLAAEKVIFRWYTEDGGLVYGDEPPENAQRVELLRAKDLSPLTVIAPHKIVVENEEEPEESPNATKTVQAGPVGGMELLEQAQSLKKQIEQRYQDQGMLPEKEESP